MNGLIRHFNYRHGIAAMQKCKVKCGQGDCSQTFDGVHAFRIHLKRFHPTDPYPVELPVDEDRSDMDCDSGCDGVGYVGGVNMDGAASSKCLCIEEIQKMITDFLVVLKSKGCIVCNCCCAFENLMKFGVCCKWHGINVPKNF